jgi:hypothetical protein
VVPKKNQKTSDVKIMTIKRRNIVMRMRLQGYTYRQIIAEMDKWSRESGITLPKNYDERKAFLDVDRELSKVSAENDALRKQLFDLENERIDILQSGIWKEAATGNEHKIDRVLKIMERRSKYWGLDAPVKTQAEVSGTLNIEELMDEWSEQAEKLEAEQREMQQAGDDGETE